MTTSREELLARAIKAIEGWQRNRMTTFTPSNILSDFGDEILAALRLAAKPEDALREAATAVSKHLAQMADNIGGMYAPELERLSRTLSAPVPSGGGTDEMEFWDQNGVWRTIKLERGSNHECGWRVPENADWKVVQMVPSPAGAAEPDIVQACIEIVQRYDDCGAAFIVEKLQELALSLQSTGDQRTPQVCADAGPAVIVEDDGSGDPLPAGWTPPSERDKERKNL